MLKTIFKITHNSDTCHTEITILGFKIKIKNKKMAKKKTNCNQNNWTLAYIKHVGKHSYGMNKCVFGSCTCTIGSFCSFGPDSKIGVSQHVTSGISLHPFAYEKAYGDFIEQDYMEEYYKLNKPIKIGNDVWIGANAIIFPGVNIGNGAIIAAGSIVRDDVPPYAIVAGVPAKIRKYRFPEEQINKLQKIQWWNLEDESIKRIAPLFRKPEFFFKHFEKF